MKLGRKTFIILPSEDILVNDVLRSLLSILLNEPQLFFTGRLRPCWFMSQVITHLCSIIHLSSCTAVLGLLGSYKNIVNAVEDLKYFVKVHRKSRSNMNMKNE